MRDVDAFEHDDAAYVLGLLSEADRTAFEAHMSTCPACSARVQGLSTTVDMLATVSADDMVALSAADVAAAESGEDQVPDTLLPGLLRRAGVARRRQRRTVGGVAGLAAASLIAVVAIVWPSAGAAPAPGLALSEVRATPLRATAAISDTAWGTRISLDCNYYGGTPAGAAKAPYGLIVVARNGTRYSLGTWTVTAGAHTKFTSGSALPSSAIRDVEITRGDGTPVLALTLHA